MAHPGQTLENPLTGERFEAGPGESVVVAPGVTHSFANVGSVEAALRIEVRPALRMEEMLETVARLARAGFMHRRGLPRNPLRLAALAREFAQEAHAPYLPRELQRALLAPFAHFGRRLPTAPCSSRPLPLNARPA